MTAVAIRRDAGPCDLATKAERGIATLTMLAVQAAVLRPGCCSGALPRTADPAETTDSVVLRHPMTVIRDSDGFWTTEIVCGS